MLEGHSDVQWRVFQQLEGLLDRPESDRTKCRGLGGGKGPGEPRPLVWRRRGKEEEEEELEGLFVCSGFALMTLVW